MHILFDILLVVLFGFLVLMGYLRGFMKTVLSFGRLFLTVILTLLFGSAFSGWIDKTFVNPKVFESVYAKVSEVAGNAAEGVEGLIERIPAAFRGFVDTAALQDKYGEGGATMEAMVTDVSHTISDAMSIVISTVIGYLLLFVIIFILLTVAIFIVGKLVKLPVIKGCDKFLGLGVGVISGLIAVTLVSTVLYAIVYVTGDMSAFDNSVIFKLVHKINFFGFVLDKIIG